MLNVEKTAVVADGATEHGAAKSGIGDKIAPVLAITGLVALAGAFWAVNGASVFAELISSAWALCF